MESAPLAIPPSQETLTLEEVLIRAREGKQRLIAAGLSTARNIERRLAWKRSRGIDSTVEERLCGLESRLPLGGLLVQGRSAGGLGD